MSVEIEEELNITEHSSLEKSNDIQEEIERVEIFNDIMEKRNEATVTDPEYRIIGGVHLIEGKGLVGDEYFVNCNPLSVDEESLYKRLVNDEISENKIIERPLIISRSTRELNIERNSQTAMSDNKVEAQKYATVVINGEVNGVEISFPVTRMIDLEEAIEQYSSKQELPEKVEIDSRKKVTTKSELQELWDNYIRHLGVIFLVLSALTAIFAQLVSLLLITITVFLFGQVMSDIVVEDRRDVDKLKFTKLSSTGARRGYDTFTLNDQEERTTYTTVRITNTGSVIRTEDEESGIQWVSEKDEGIIPEDVRHILKTYDDIDEVMTVRVGKKSDGFTGWEAEDGETVILPQEN